MQTQITLIKDSYAMAPESLFFEGGGKELEQMPCFFYLIRHERGNILFDVGTPPGDIVRERYGYILHDKRSLSDLLAVAGVTPDSIETVIISHLHWDHFNESALLFSNATFYVQRAEVQDAAAPSRRDEYDRAHVSLICRELYDRVTFVDGEYLLAPGIRLIPLPGHTVGLQGAVIETGASRVVLASDAAFTYRNLKENRPVGVYVDRDDLLASMQRVRAEGDIIIPQHESAVLDRFPSGTIP